MTDVNMFTIYMQYSGATAAAIKGEVNEYIREYLGDADGELKAHISAKSSKDKDEPDRLFIEIKSTLYQEERIAFMSWLAENPLWEVAALTAIARHINSGFELITEGYLYNRARQQIMVSYMKPELREWVVRECSDYDSCAEQQSAADMSWLVLEHAHKLDELVVALRRDHDAS